MPSKTYVKTLTSVAASIKSTLTFSCAVICGNGKFCVHTKISCSCNNKFYKFILSFSYGVYSWTERNEHCREKKDSYIAT